MSNRESLEQIVVGYRARLGFTGGIMAAGDRALDIALDVLKSPKKKLESANAAG
ncbi:MAG: hypothetical protein U0Y68_23650 [Blastocatellia bacterium]